MKAGFFMWTNFVVSIEAILPIFITIGIGMLIKRAGMITSEQVKVFNKITFITCYSSMMFSNIYGKELDEALDMRSIVFAASGVFAVFLLSTVFTLAIEKKQKTRGAMIQALFRSNFVILGIPVVANVFGAENCTLTAGLITVVVPVFNILAVIVLEVFRGTKPNAKKIIISVLINPMIIGAVVGLTANLTGVTVPQFIVSPINSLGAAATPIALLILGMSFSKSSIENCKRNLIIVCIAKLIVIPGIMLSIAVALGFRDVALVSFVALFASPCAIASFTMAQEMDSDVELAGNCVVFTSLLSCITMFLWIFTLKCMGLF